LNSDKIQQNELLSYFEKFIRNEVHGETNVLDIGCGTAEFLYRIGHLEGIKKLIGLDKSPISKLIQSDYSRYDIDGKFNQIIFEIRQLPESDREYQYYKIFTEYVLEKKPLSAKEYTNKYKITYGKDFLQTKYESDYFDFVLLNRVLHKVENPHNFIAQTRLIVKPQKFLFVSQPTSKYIEQKVFEDIGFEIISKHTTSISETKWISKWYKRNSV